MSLASPDVLRLGFKKRKIQLATQKFKKYI